MYAHLTKFTLALGILLMGAGAIESVQAQTTFNWHNNTNCEYNGVVQFRSISAPYTYQATYPNLPPNSNTPVSIPAGYEVYSIEATLAGTGTGCYIGTVRNDCMLPACDDSSGTVILTWASATSAEIND